MDYFGKWVIKDFLVGTEDGIQKMTVQEVLAAEDSEEMEMYQEFANAVIVISPEGTVNTYFAISEDQVEEARAEGLEITEYGMLVESRELKVENGEYLYDTGIRGEFAGQEVSSFAKLKLDEEGYLPFGGGMFRLEKVR